LNGPDELRANAVVATGSSIPFRRRVATCAASSFQRLAHLAQERRGREWLLDEREATIDPRLLRGGLIGVAGDVLEGLSCSPRSLGQKNGELQKSLFEAVKGCGGALQVVASPHGLEIRGRPLNP